MSLFQIYYAPVFSPAVSAARLTTDGAHLAAEMTQMLDLEPSSQLQSLGSRLTPQLLAVKLPLSCAKHTSQSFDQSGTHALNL